MNFDLLNYTIRSAQSALLSGDIRSIDLVEAAILRAESQKDLNVFITLTSDHARKSARASDQRIKASTARPLEGIPIAVKDIFCTKNIKTTAGSQILHNFIPDYESTVTQKLWDAGAILIGKTNMDEFAMGFSTENSIFGPTINPVGRNLGYDNLSPGGSSGGSAAAVAAGMSLASIGTDTGGSIRQPSSFCGLVGMKPTYGLCSRWGVASYASSFDQPGAFGKTVNDVARLLNVMTGLDTKDATSIDKSNLNFLKAGALAPHKIKVGFLTELSESGTEETHHIWQIAKNILQEQNIEIVPISFPNLKYALPAYYIIALSEASSNLARYDGVRYGYRASNFSNLTEMYEKTRSNGFGDETIRRILMGTFSLSSGYYDAYFKHAQKVRRLISNNFADVFNQVDILVMPTTPSGAFTLGENSDNPIQMYLQDVFTVPINLAGLPACSIPIAKDKRKMPLGLQIVGPRFSDETVISMAEFLEGSLAESHERD